MPPGRRRHRGSVLDERPAIRPERGRHIHRSWSQQGSAAAGAGTPEGLFPDVLAESVLVGRTGGGNAWRRATATMRHTTDGQCRGRKQGCGPGQGTCAGVTAKTSPHRRRGISRDSCEPQPAGRLVADSADLAAQHRVLVPERQEFGIFARFALGRHHQTSEQAASEQVDSREDHPAMMSARRPGQIG